jgi:DNA-binding transcriptional ArsR family regulator
MALTDTEPHDAHHASDVDMLDTHKLRTAAQAAVRALRVMANEDRLLLLCQLSQGELCVQDLEALLDIRQPTLSQQLGVLRNEGVVSTRRDGRRIYYSVSDPQLLQVLGALYTTYCPKE